MNKIHILIGLTILFLTSCSNSKETYLKNLQELRTNLQQTNDTVYTYSLENHFAIWLHQETIGEDMYDYEEVQTLYHYDLKSKVQTKLFTVKEDTMTLKNKGVPFVMKEINHLSITPDSMAILIGDAYLTWNDWGRRSKIYMLPLTEKKSLIELCFEEELDEDISFDIKGGAHIGPLPRWNGNGYIAWKRTELPTFIDDEKAWKFANQLYRYTTNGEEEPLALGDLTISDSAYCLNEDGNYTELSSQILSNTDELRREYVLANKYRVEDLFKIIKNEILFDNTFGTGKNKKICYFELILKKVQQSRDNPNNYIVKGDGFHFVTDEKLFTQFEYPKQVIIQAYVADRERSLRELQSNPFAANLISGLMGIASITPNGSAALADINEMDERFVLSNVELLYY